MGPVCAALAASAAGLHAQVSADSMARRDSIPRLAPVEVAAQRIAGVPTLAPYALSVRTAAALPKGAPALALDDALRGIPGVQVDNRFNFALGERISIRGAGARAQFGVRGVRMLIDGIPATLPDGQTTLNQVDLGTIARVEVVRGPVATLFGNAGGGAILIETADPPIVPFGIGAALEAGSHGMVRTSMLAGGTQGGASYLASVSRLAYAGFRSHSSADNRYGAARASWLGRRDLVRALVNVVAYDALNPGSLSDSLLRIDRHQAFRNNVLQRTGEAGRQQQAGVQWLRGLRDGRELEVTSWILDRGIDNPIPGRVVVVDRVAGGARALLRGTLARAAWTAGLEHEQQRDSRRNFVNDSGAHGALTLDQGERVAGTGAFIQASVPVHARVVVTSGVRHDRTAFRVRDRFVTATDPDDSGARTLSALSPSAGVSVLLGAGTTIYGNAGSAFETPTTTELANRPDGAGGFNPLLQPQRSLSYELGARHVAPRGVAQLAVYRALVRDALIPFEVPDAAGRQFFRNAGRTATAGIEAGATVHATRALRLDGAYTYTDARFREYAVGSASFSGNAIPGIAPHRFDLSATGAPRWGFVALDARGQSAMTVNDANDASSPGHLLFDLRAGTRPRRTGRWDLAFTGGVQNLGGARYNASVVVNAFGRRYFEPGPGRTVHLGATVSPRQ